MDTSTEPTAPAHYFDSEFAAEALAEIVRYGMDNDRSPAEVASNVLAPDREPTEDDGEPSAEERIHRMLHYCDQELARRKDQIGCDPRDVTGMVPIRVIRTILEGDPA